MKLFGNSTFVSLCKIEQTPIWLSRVVNETTLDPLEYKLDNFFINLHRKESKHIIDHWCFNTVRNILSKEIQQSYKHPVGANGNRFFRNIIDNQTLKIIKCWNNAWLHCFFWQLFDNQFEIVQRAHLSIHDMEPKLPPNASPREIIMNLKQFFFEAIERPLIKPDLGVCMIAMIDDNRFHGKVKCARVHFIHFFFITDHDVF